MKIKITFLSLLAVSAAFVASAQVVENDDMYFNAKDRAKMQASKPLTLKNISSEHEIATAINPSDGYSARNVNPEYISQSKVGSSNTVEDAPYFTPNYTPASVNQNLNTNSSYWNNCNCATAGYNPYFGMMPGFGSPYSSFYPYSMYGYNPYGYGFNNIYNSGLNFSMSLGYGMGSYYPWGSNAWAWGGSPFWNNYYGANYYNNWGWNNIYYPNNVVIINSDNYNRNVAYGKRTSRSSDLDNVVNTSNRSTTMTTIDSQGRARGSNGRASGDANSTSYYQLGWRTNPETSTTRSSTWGNSGRSGSDNSGFSNGRTSNSSFFDNGGGSRSSNFSGGNSNFSSGGGSRSSGSVGGGSSSGARRGRD
jgi:hypothetical protein